jgi:hypothetical protein
MNYYFDTHVRVNETNHFLISQKIYILYIIIYYIILPGVSSDVNGTTWMRRVELQNDDVVGVGMQQSDLPMIQFFLNGEPLFESAVNRFRGTVYPAICFPESSADQLKLHFVMDEDDFKQKEQGDKFGPIIAARSIV